MVVAVISEAVIKNLLFTAKLVPILKDIIGRPRPMLIIVIKRGLSISAMVTTAATIVAIRLWCAWFVADSAFFSFY